MELTTGAAHKINNSGGEHVTAHMLASKQNMVFNPLQA